MQHQELKNLLKLQKPNFKVELEKRKSEEKLPYSEESKDKMDSYLSRFENLATANNWDKNVWAAYFSARLKCRALDVFDSLSTEDAMNYEKFKDALLENFDMTDAGLEISFIMVSPKSRKRLYSLVAD